MFVCFFFLHFKKLFINCRGWREVVTRVDKESKNGELDYLNKIIDSFNYANSHLSIEAY